MPLDYNDDNEEDRQFKKDLIKIGILAGLALAASIFACLVW